MDSEGKIRSNKTVPGLKVSVWHDGTRTASLQRHLELQDFSMQSAKTNLRRAAGLGPGTQGSGLHPVRGELFFLIRKD